MKKQNIRGRFSWRCGIAFGVGLFVFTSVWALGSFENLGKQVSTLSDKKQEDLVCSRMKERKKLWHNDREMELGEFPCSKAFVLEKGQVDPANQKKTFDSVGQTEWVKRVEDTMAFEREMLQAENDLRELTGNMSYFSDRSMGGEAHGLMPTFDLIDDLDAIDEVLFGEKHTRPEPSFSFQESGGMSGSKGEWQDGKEEVAKATASSEKNANGNDYGEDESIAGTIAHMKEVYADGKGGETPLSSRSQATCNLKLSGDQAIKRTSRSPTVSESTEVATNKEEKVGEAFEALEEQIITEPPCKTKTLEDSSEYNMSNPDTNEAIDECRVLKEESYQQRFDAIKKEKLMEGENEYFQRILRAIDQWNKDFETWYDQIVVQKKEYKELSEKMKCR